jgi:hypothetical protein
MLMIHYFPLSPPPFPYGSLFSIKLNHMLHRYKNRI